MPAAASTRRIATVVSAVPDATSARSSTSRFARPAGAHDQPGGDRAAGDDQHVLLEVRTAPCLVGP